MLTPIDMDYLAGLLDGEGTITLAKREIHAFRVPSVSVQMCEESLIRKLHQQFGGKFMVRNPRKKNHKTTYTWTLDGPAAVKLSESVYPKLRVIDKKLRSSIIVNDIAPRIKRNGKYSSDERTHREQLEKLFFDLTPSRNSPIYHPVTV